MAGDPAAGAAARRRPRRACTGDPGPAVGPVRRDAAASCCSGARETGPVVLGVDALGLGRPGRDQRERVPAVMAAGRSSCRCARYLVALRLPARRVHRFDRARAASTGCPGLARLRQGARSTTRSGRSAACWTGWGYQRRCDGEPELPWCCQAAAAQPQPAPGGPDHRGCSAGCARDPAALPRRRGDAARLQRAVAALGYCDPPAAPQYSDVPGASTGTSARLGRLGRALARHLDADARGSAASSAPCWPRSAGGWPASTRRSPSPPTGPGRPARPGSRPSTGCRSATTSSGTAGLSGRAGQAAVARDQGQLPAAGPHVLPRPAGMGVDPAAVRPGHGALGTPRSIAALIGPTRA